MSESLLYPGSYLKQQDFQEQLNNKADLAGGKVPEEQLPASSGGSSIEVAATYAAILASTDIRFVYVTADENNNGDSSLYIHNGTTLKLIQTIS